MDGGLTLELHATLDDLRKAQDTIEALCRAEGIPSDVQARLAIIVEELFTNTIKYGYGRECAEPIRVVLSHGKLLSLVYEDAAPPFDPTLDRAEPSMSDDPDERPIGGLGISLVLGFAAKAEYQRWKPKS